jgi:nucleoside-diphosphate-sugar epimerase
VDDAASADIAMTPDRVRAPMDITRLRQDTGFAPRYDLAAGVADLVSFNRASV